MMWAYGKDERCNDDRQKVSKVKRRKRRGNAGEVEGEWGSMGGEGF